MGPDPETLKSLYRYRVGWFRSASIGFNWDEDVGYIEEVGGGLRLTRCRCTDVSRWDHMVNVGIYY